MELRNIACKGIERQEKKILIIGAAYIPYLFKK